MAEGIAQWLDRLRLGLYAQAFAENGVELQHLAHLTDDDLNAFFRIGQAAQGVVQRRDTVRAPRAI